MNNIFKLSSTILKDKDTCMDWFREQGALPSTTERVCHWCPRGKPMTWDPDVGYAGRWRCRANHGNRGVLSVMATEGTWFEHVKIDPRKVVLLVYAFANKFSTQQAIRETSIGDDITSSATVNDWYSYCREVCMIALDDKFDQQGKIGGVGHVVEIDESLIGKRKYNRGRAKVGQWILGMIDRTTGDYRLELCPDNKRRAEDLIPLIEKHVIEGTEVHTDEWKAYGSLKDKYVHKTVNHSEHFVDPESGAHTQTIEGSWKNLKYELIRRGFDRENLAMHLCEYLWHRECKREQLDPFDKLWKDVVKVYPAFDYEF